MKIGPPGEVIEYSVGGGEKAHQIRERESAGKTLHRHGGGYCSTCNRNG